MSAHFSVAAHKFIKSQEVGVLSTLARNGEVQGVAVYYRFNDGKFYILTKSESSKAHNMLANHQVAFTIFDASEMKTLQISGNARIESDKSIKNKIFKELTSPRQYGDENLMPPVTQLESGGFIAFRITPYAAKFNDYNNRHQLVSTAHQY